MTEPKEQRDRQSLSPIITDKNWSKELEKPIYEEWKKSKAYKFNPKSKRPIYSIDTPPPYVNAPVHMGHCTTYILMDMFARFHRMIGEEVLFPLGLDRNGLPIEIATEKKFDVTPGKIPREKFIEYCKKLLEEFSLKSTETFLRSGISFSSWEAGNKPGDVYLTDSDEYRALTQATFIDLWKKKLIVKDTRVNNWCPGCRTTVADNEIDYVEVPSKFNDVVFTVKETGEKIIIGTTRPELICTCGVVFFHPEDNRYKRLEGKTAVTPIYGKEVPLKANPVVDQNFGTGLLMTCSAGDLEDIRIFRELGLKSTIAIDQNGKMNEHAGFLKDLKVKEAREKMIETLKEKGLLVKSVEIKHRTPVCERSKNEIEFIEMEEYYLKQLDFLKDVRAVSEEIKFYSEKNKQFLTDWINSVSIDWPISRRRVYATEIPLWYCENKDCGEVIVPPKGKYYRPWTDKVPVDTCPKCGGKKFRGEERVFDTWFDSSISPLYILQYLEDPKFYKKAFPATLRPQGKDIVRTWLYYTLLRCFQLTGKPIFRDVWIHNHILDGQGRKMSKRLGNVVDPAQLIDRFGAEPIRLWAALEGNLTDADFMCSEDKIQGNSKFLTKLWNVSRFCSMFPVTEAATIKTSVLDKWVLKEINELAFLAWQRYQEYDFHAPVVKIRHFIWEVFASHYLEMIKSRAYNEAGAFSKDEQAGAIFTINQVLDIALKLLAPVIPFLTSKIYKELKGKDIHKEPFPKIEGFPFKLDFTTEEILDLNSKIWKEKKGKGLSLAEPIETFEIPKKFQQIEKELEMHKIKKIKWI